MSPSRRCLRRKVTNGARLSNLRPSRVQAPNARAVGWDPIVKRPVIRSSLEYIKDVGNHVLFLFVGAERALVTIHTCLLPQSTLEHLQQEAMHNGIYWVQDVDLELFKLYRASKYQNRFFSKHANDKIVPDVGDAVEFHDKEWSRLIELYLLGIYLHDEQFANIATDAILEKVDVDRPVRYPTSFAAHVYAHTGAGDRLRKMLVDLHVWIGEGTGIEQPHDDASGPRSFIEAVRAGVADLSNSVFDVDLDEYEKPWTHNRCLYHTHLKTPVCGR